MLAVLPRILTWQMTPNFSAGRLRLAGEIRPVQGGLDRLREAAKHGYKRAIVPRANVPKQAVADIEVVGVRRLSDAIEAL